MKAAIRHLYVPLIAHHLQTLNLCMYLYAKSGMKLTKSHHSAEDVIKFLLKFFVSINL